MLYKETKGTGKDIILLHGWGFHSGIWQSVADELSQYFRVTMFDLPGFGRSSLISENYDLISLTKMVLNLSPEKAIYLGWSLGGLVATAIACKHPERIERLITIASNPCFIANDDWPGVSSHLLEQFSQELADDYKTTLQRFLILQSNIDNNQRHKTRQLQQELIKYGEPSAMALNSGLNILRNTDLREELKNIKCPQLSIFGRLDTIVPIQVKTQLELLKPNIETALIDHASHAPFLSHPDEILQRVRKFLNG